MRLLFSLLILATFVNASIILNKGVEKIDDFEMAYYYDESNTLSIKDIEKLNFNQTTSNKFAFGFLMGTSWLKFTLANNSNREEFLLNLNEPWHHNVNLYTIENEKIIESKEGLSVLFKNKNIKDTTPTFVIHVKKGETKTFYIELTALVSTFGKFTIYLNKASYVQEKVLSVGLYMLYLGGALIVIILNLFLFLTLKERIYLYYSLYVFTLSISVLVLAGVMGYIIHDSSYVLQFFSPLSIFFLIIFSKELLQTSIYAPTLNKLLNFFGILSLIFAPLILVNIVVWFPIFNISLVLSLFLILFTSFRSWQKGNRDAMYYIVFMLMYISSLSIFALLSVSALEYNNFTRYSFVYASFFEISFFSLVLANRFNKTKIEKQLVEATLKDTKELANHDSLTKLYNRQYLETHSAHYFNEAVANKQALCIMMLDIDKFKLVNDNYGHGVGDIVLSSVANIFTTITRESDVVVRYGGEEFIIILPNTSLENTQVVAEKIRANIENTKMKYEDDKELFVTISLGISLLKSEDTSIESIITRADKALYVSKNGGRNRVSVL